MSFCKFLDNWMLATQIAQLERNIEAEEAVKFREMQ